jgi:hypothetical protein
MARFKNGNLVIDNDERIQIGGEMLFTFNPLSLSNREARGDIITMTIDTDGSTFGFTQHIRTNGFLEPADSVSIGQMPAVALALEDGVGSKRVLLRGFVRYDNWSWSPGSPLYLDQVPGGMIHGAPPCEQFVGVAMTTKIIYFNPSFTVSGDCGGGGGEG